MNTFIFVFLSNKPKVINKTNINNIDISEWMATHHLKLNLDKTELVFLPGKGCPHRDLSITIENTVVSPTQSARNLGVILDDQLSFTANIAAITRSCRFLLYNIRRIRSATSGRLVTPSLRSPCGRSTRSLLMSSYVESI